MASKYLFDAIKQLRDEKDRLDQIIKNLEALASGTPRRGRPPKVLSNLEPKAAKKSAKKKARKKVRKNAR